MSFNIAWRIFASKIIANRVFTHADRLRDASVALAFRGELGYGLAAFFDVHPNVAAKPFVHPSSGGPRFAYERSVALVNYFDNCLANRERATIKLLRQTI